MGSSRYQGLWVPLVTPFHAGRLDLAALRRLLDQLRPTALAGYVVCGSTGEAASLTHDEQLATLDAVLDHGDKPVLMGLAGTRADEMLPRLRDLARRPLTGLLVSSPSYVRPAQAGIVAHFQALADASPVPLALYDIPARTGVEMTLETLLTLAGHPNIQALKDCGTSQEKTRALIDDGRLAVLAGDDERVFSTLCLGGAGAIAASAHVLSDRWAELVAHTLAGRLAEARRLVHALTPLTRALFAEPNPSLLKAVLARQGPIGAEVRAPHVPGSPEGLARAWAALDAAERRLRN